MSGDIGIAPTAAGGQAQRAAAAVGATSGSGVYDHQAALQLYINYFIVSLAVPSAPIVTNFTTTLYPLPPSS